MTSGCLHDQPADQLWLPFHVKDLVASAEMRISLLTKRTVPPRGCNNPPRMGKRALSKSTNGTRARTCSSGARGPVTQKVQEIYSAAVRGEVGRGREAAVPPVRCGEAAEDAAEPQGEKLLR